MAVLITATRLLHQGMAQAPLGPKRLNAEGADKSDEESLPHFKHERCCFVSKIAGEASPALNVVIVSLFVNRVARERNTLEETQLAATATRAAQHSSKVNVSYSCQRS